MNKLLALALVPLALAAALPARAQYYAPPPPGYYEPPPRRYYRPEPQFGRHCDAVAQTAYGPRQVFCRIIEPKPLGMECACPPPPPPPGYPRGPFVPGSTVR